MADTTTTTAETTRTPRTFEILDFDHKYCEGFGGLKGMIQALGDEVNYFDKRGETTVDIEYLKGFLERANNIMVAVDNCKRSS
jgi:hypothetical protein